MSVRTFDRWRSMSPLQHIRQAGNVWVFGRIGTGKDALILRLNEKMKKWKYRPTVRISDHGFYGLAAVLVNNDVIIHTRRNPLGAKVYRVVVTKNQGRFIFSVGLIQTQRAR